MPRFHRQDLSIEGFRLLQAPGLVMLDCKFKCLRDGHGLLNLPRSRKRKWLDLGFGFYHSAVMEIRSYTNPSRSDFSVLRQLCNSIPPHPLRGGTLIALASRVRWPGGCHPFLSRRVVRLSDRLCGEAFCCQAMKTSRTDMQRLKGVVRGALQGVGFRPIPYSRTMTCCCRGARAEILASRLTGRMSRVTKRNSLAERSA